MHIRVLLLAGLILSTLAVDARLARAQDPASSEREEPADQADLEPEPGADAEAKPVAEPAPATPIPRPTGAHKGVEEIVIQAGESQAAADFESADSVTAFDASDLEALGAQSVADLADFTPNLEIVTSGSTTPTFFIRGVGLNDFNPNSSGAVALYQDDVPLNSPALQLGTIFDMEAVNILRGPQGTGPARNASAGAIKLYSRRPSGEFGAFLRSTFGNYNALDFEGAIEAPIHEDLLSARFAFRFSERDGYAKNGCGNAPPMSERAANETNNRAVTPSGKIDLPSGGSIPNGPVGGLDLDGPTYSFKLFEPPNWDGDPETLISRPFSVCGEGLPGKILGVGQVSPIKEGLPTRVNDLGNWAARGTLLFQPTLDMEWLLIARGSRRDEQSRLGQSHGVTAWKTYDPKCLEDLAPGDNIEQCRNQGTLGGQDYTESPGYQPREVIERYRALNPCVGPDGQTTTPAGLALCPIPSDPMVVDAAAAFLAENKAKLQLAEELARDLDSDPHHGDYDRVGPTKNDTWGVSLKGDIALGESLFLTTVSGYDTYDRLVDIDLDFSPNELFEIATADQGWQLTQGLELDGQFTEELPLRWQLGGFYLMETLDVQADITQPPNIRQTGGVSAREYTQKLWSAAGYGSFEWDFWDDFTLDGGVRYNWEHKTMDSVLTVNTGPLPPYAAAKSWQAPTGTIRLTYRFREDTHAFWKYTRGWKGGHFNATGSRRLGITAAEPESINAFETGVRGSWFNGRLGLDFSLFHYDYSNYQIFIAQQQFLAQPEFVVINASDAEVYGAELDAVARPLPGMFLQVRAGWIESSFIKFLQNQTAFVGSGNESNPVDIQIDNSGNPLLNSPKFKVSLTAEQMVPLGHYGSLTFRYDGAWTDDTNYDPTNARGVPDINGTQILPEHTIGQRAFWLHNLRVGYRTPGGNVEVAGWIRNLTDEVYKNFAFDAVTFSSTTIYFVGEPRTYGVSATITF